MKENDGTSEAARHLSALGASKGGRARAAALSPAERSDIARKAAQARWGQKGDSPRARPRISPRREARALSAEWVDQFRRTDTAWREVYTAVELAALDAALDEFVETLPDPATSLFFRLPKGSKGGPS